MVPAAAVIPPPRVYTNDAAFKTFVVQLYIGDLVLYFFRDLYYIVTMLASFKAYLIIYFV